MIRIIEHKLEGEESEQLLIRRRFVPLEITLSENGQYKTFKEKIPYVTRKVVGVVITHDAPDHMMYHNRIYVGSEPDSYINQELVCGLKDDLIGSQAVTYQIEVKDGEKLYYAQPKRLEIPELKVNGSYEKFKDPVVISIRDFWTDFDEDYQVWESRYAGLGMVDFYVNPASLENGEDESDANEEDDD